MYSGLCRPSDRLTLTASCRRPCPTRMPGQAPSAPEDNGRRPEPHVPSETSVTPHARTVGTADNNSAMTVSPAYEFAQAALDASEAIPEWASFLESTHLTPEHVRR